MRNVSELDAIGRKYGTDKSSLDHDYLSFYETRLGHLRDNSFLLIKIGIFKGASLRTWSEYFTKATIAGIDIDEDTKKHEAENRPVFIGDASKSETIDAVTGKLGLPTIVIDDGSHIWHHQIETLRYMWPKILPGGIFIMEDIHTSMPRQLAMSPWYSGFSGISTYDYIQKLNRAVVAGDDLSPELPHDGFVGNYFRTVRSIEWHRKTCIIYKM